MSDTYAGVNEEEKPKSNEKLWTVLYCLRWVVGFVVILFCASILYTFLGFYVVVFSRISISADFGVPLIIDTDGNYDDMYGILYMIAHPNVNIRGISVTETGFANDDVTTLANLLRLIRHFNQDHLPVIKASNETVTAQGGINKKNYMSAIFEQGAADMYGAAPLLPTTNRVGFDYPFETMYSDIVVNQKQKVRILGLGPLTNIANWLAKASKKAKANIERIFITGGAFNVTGNIVRAGNGTLTQVREFDNEEWNTFLDPTATEIVLSANVPITIIPLDVMSMVRMNGTWVQEVAALQKDYYRARLLFTTIEGMKTKFDNLGLLYFQDALASYLATLDYTHFESVETQNANVTVDDVTGAIAYSSPTSKEQYPVSIVTGFKQEAFFKRFYEWLK